MKFHGEKRGKEERDRMVGGNTEIRRVESNGEELDLRTLSIYLFIYSR